MLQRPQHTRKGSLPDTSCLLRLDICPSQSRMFVFRYNPPCRLSIKRIFDPLSAPIITQKVIILFKVVVCFTLLSQLATC